jgi:hypothetical protein
MAVRTLCLSALFFLAPTLSSAQECKIKFAVVYNDGETLQIGLTPEQKKMWDHHAPKKFKGLCADDKDPNYIILWSEGLSGAELTKVGLDHFNHLRSTGEIPGGNSNVKNFSLMSTTIPLRPAGQVRDRTDYVVLHASKSPYIIVRQGQGYQDVPRGVTNHPSQSAKTTDTASTIADPTVALENALKWLKKEKKL